jgi:hypothetical protein
MKNKLTRILVTKLNTNTHEELKRLASEERRSLSNMSRIIIEDYIGKLKEGMKNE